jgi:hypothetical protein
MGEIVTFEGKNNMTAAEVKGQVQLIQQIMATVMKDGEHYGEVPGCGKKKVLLKSGAEKIAMTFRLGAEFEEISGSGETDSFICYKINCKLIHIPTGNVVGNGRGTCNSKEKKYATRSVYANKATEEEKAIGKSETRKDRNNNSYEALVIPQNPWDVQNTIYKMACKRAMVAAILNATAASDLFTQDLEDLPEGTVVDDNGGEKHSDKPNTTAPQKTQTQGPATGSVDVISEGQGKRFYAIAKGKGMTDQDMKELLVYECNVEHSRDIPRAEYDRVIEAVQAWKKA